MLEILLDLKTKSVAAKYLGLATPNNILTIRRHA
jgi:hypothetical protein